MTIGTAVSEADGRHWAEQLCIDGGPGVKTAIKALVRRLLAYSPDGRTAPVRERLATVSHRGRPYVPDHEGDLIFRLIADAGRPNCLEIGFGTGSTAAYMLAGIAALGEGHVTSIDFSADNFNHLGKALVGACESHTLIEENSNAVVPRLFGEGRRFDFVFVDGWKTFDHLTMEAYFLARMLTVGGAIMFDDAFMPSVHRVISLLKRFYDFKEVGYRDLGQGARLRLWLALIFRTSRRPYRALIKEHDIERMPVMNDWNFDARL